MQILTLLSHKGGVGKTTLVYNLAAVMAARGYRVVMVDADPQGSLTHMTGFKREPGLYDLIERDASFGQILKEIPAPVYRRFEDDGMLMLLPGNAETDNINVQRNAKRFRDRLRSLEGDFDLVLIDTNPSPSKLHVGAYLATDAILYPTIPEELPLLGLLDSLEFTGFANEWRLEMGYREIAVAGIVPMMVRKYTVQHQQYLAAMRERWGDKAIWPEIGQSTTWSEAAAYHKPVDVYRNGSTAATQLWEIVERLERYVKREQRQQATV